MGGAIEVTMLGRFEVAVDGVPVAEDAWRRRQAAALVKLLALSPGGSRHREQVVDALWPDLSPADAAPRLHKAAHFARKAIGEGTLAASGDLLSLGGPWPLAVDVDRFVTAAEGALALGDAAGAKRALAHWTGPLLPADLYEPWTESTRDRLEHLRRRLLRQAGRWDELVAEDPTDEEAHLALMRAMASAGDRRGALRQYERLDRMPRSSSTTSWWPPTWPRRPVGGPVSPPRPACRRRCSPSSRPQRRAAAGARSSSAPRPAPLPAPS